MKRKKVNRERPFPGLTKTPEVGDIWIALYPYREKGNYEKARPVLIKEINDDYIVIQKITTRSDKNIKINNDKKLFKQQSYLSKDTAKISPYKLIRRIQSVQIGRINLQDKK